jgi:hypothetical protein
MRFCAHKGATRNLEKYLSPAPPMRFGALSFTQKRNTPAYMRRCSARRKELAWSAYWNGAERTHFGCAADQTNPNKANENAPKTPLAGRQGRFRHFRHQRAGVERTH